MSEVPKIRRSSWETAPGKRLQPGRRTRRRRGGQKRDRQESEAKDDESNSAEDLDGTIATDRMRALNKANLKTKSLHRRLLEMIKNDGRLDGSISGAPD